MERRRRWRCPVVVAMAVTAWSSVRAVVYTFASTPGKKWPSSSSVLTQGRFRHSMQRDIAVSMAAGVKLTTTVAERELLKELGFTEEEAIIMRPEIAEKCLEKGLKRPWGDGSMPEAWVNEAMRDAMQAGELGSAQPKYATGSRMLGAGDPRASSSREEEENKRLVKEEDDETVIPAMELPFDPTLIPLFVILAFLIPVTYWAVNVPKYDIPEYSLSKGINADLVGENSPLKKLQATTPTVADSKDNWKSAAKELIAEGKAPNRITSLIPR